MSDQPDNPLLVLVRRIEERMARMDHRLSGMERLAAGTAANVADLRISLLDLAGRIDRIERRLDLRDA